MPPQSKEINGTRLDMRLHRAIAVVTSYVMNEYDKSRVGPHTVPSAFAKYIGGPLMPVTLGTVLL